MKINDIYSGFRLVKKTKIEEIDANLLEFKHEKSGGSLAYIECDDTNKSFMAGFRTLPSDSTGVCHIIEHTVLCGSKKFPLKEPFVNLLKGSMATFLNAMTAYDWTAYPVASQNDKDFHNLMETYLDAVFAPISVLDPKPFLQEGWHYELLNKDDDLTIKGVVYNEMKGAMSSVDSQLNELILKRMYNDSGYGVNSGGDPKVIPNLTYEDYKAFYHKHYHPQNALLVLYGKMDLLSQLDFIDKEYLSHFKASDDLIKIEKPKALIDLDYEEDYAISSNETEENNAYLGISFALPEASNVEENLAFSILRDALFGTNDSPLKKTLLDLNLCDDIDSSIDDDCITPSLQISIKKTDKKNKQLFYDTIINECKKYVKNGLDKKALLATINFAEFKHKELDMGTMPKGVIFAISLMQSFNYDIPLEDALVANKYFKKFKELINDNYFENLLEKYIINSRHYVIVTLNPSASLASESEKSFKEQMASIKALMSDEELDALIKQTNDLIKYQSSTDTEESLRKLPSLAVSDIDLNINKLSTSILHDKNVTKLVHEFNTNGIGYLNLYFDLSTLSIDELNYASMLPSLLIYLDTKNYKASELQNLIKTYLGGVSFSMAISTKKDGGSNCYLKLQASALEENIGYISKALNEIITNTIYDEKKIAVILNQAKNNTKESIIQNGMYIAMVEAQAIDVESAKIRSNLIGSTRYDFLTNAIENVSDFSLKLQDLLKRVFNRNNMIASVSGSKTIVEKLENEASLLELDDSANPKKLEASLSPNKPRALIIPSEVSYNAKTFSLNKSENDYNGALQVLAHIIRYDYLWNRVRVLGGAYGCTMQVSSITKEITLGSFRDPNCKNTYDVYDNLGKYLEEFKPTESEFNSYLIGAIGAFDQPASNSVLINNADSNFLCGISDDDRIKTKKEMKEATIDTIKSYAKLFNEFASKGSCYSIGNENAIRSSGIFAEIKEL
ncbi:MAG: hypothetical protein HP024_03205 [Acholeplasmatales bacterium]|nr:hypothetical protein [Acholeplasmatales bacterium]